MFGFSSASAFTINTFAQRAIAVGSVASGIGLTIDAWFLLAYCNATPAKFQVSPPNSLHGVGRRPDIFLPENGARPLRQIPVLLYFGTDTGVVHVHVRLRAHDVFAVGRVDGVADCGACHVVHGRRARQPTVYRIRRALHRSAYCRSDTKHPKRHLAMSLLDTSATS